MLTHPSFLLKCLANLFQYSYQFCLTDERSLNSFKITYNANICPIPGYLNFIEFWNCEYLVNHNY